MDLYQVRYFLTIAETGSFSRAAERLYLSQPSLSTGIKKLEREFGVTLFERGGRRTVLTAAGHSFLEKAKVIMAQYQAALTELKGFDEQPTLKVGVLSTMRVSELAQLVSTFQQHHPQATIELYNNTLTKLQESLEKGKIDVAITVLSDREDPASSTVLFQQPLLLAVPLNHPFAQRASVRLGDLDGQPYIDRIHCEFFQQECEILKAANIYPRVIYRATDEEWVIALVKAGLGLSVMPYWQGLSNLVYLPIADINFKRTVGIKWRPQQHSNLVKRFCRFASSHPWESMVLSVPL